MEIMLFPCRVVERHVPKMLYKFYIGIVYRL